MRRPLSQYLTVTGTYWGFTLSDGALRLLVLFHFFKLGYSPFTLALLFLMYEVAGIIANLGGGWLATRFGIPRMLLLGIAMQILGLMFLSCLDPTFGPFLSIIWVVVAQGISGLAKDITKTASKSAIKVVKIDEDEGLFRWVAWFTGSKNAMKGVGFFLGGVMLTTIGFRGGLWLMAGLLGLLAVLVVFTLPSKLGAGVSSRTIKELFSKSSSVNTVALARIFLFGARDTWFVVALPVFLYGNGWSFWEVGGFLALWTMLYGLVQGMAPAIIRITNASPISRSGTVGWAVALALALIGISVCMIVEMDVPVLITGLLVFGVFFAVNSSLHSFLIVAYAGSKKAAEDIGFYYAANAAGRLAGTFLSGFLYYQGGLLACLAGSALFLIITALMVARLPQLEA
jgi:MFS family permease